MAKGVHSKRRKRNQAIKRKILDEKVWRPRLQETSNRLLKRTFGKGDDSVITRKKNAFRFPKDPEAEFPQAEKPVYIDRRAQSANVQYLIRDSGMKKKNQLKKLHEETLSQSLKDAERRALGMEREDDVIEMNDIENADEDIDVDNIDMNKFSLNETNKGKSKSKKKKEMGMDIDQEESGRRSNMNRRNKRKNKKSKSYYIVNY